MKKLLTTIALLAGLLAPALAQDTLTKADREPEHTLTREEKNDALRRAYRLNEGRMNGPMVDLTDPRVQAEYARLLAADTVPLEQRQPLIELPKPKPVRTVAVEPTPAPRADICRRHGMRKVVSGKSWRCRR